MIGDLLQPAYDEIHLWTVALDGVDDRLLAESGTLSPDELDRARRYRFERDRRRFVVSRVALRHLLGSYLGIDEGSVVLRSGPHGKPRLAQHTSSRLSFNASRSEDLAVFAVGHDRAIGVDVERVREDRDLEPLAHRVLNVAELRAFGQLEPKRRRGAFYRSWTRKEACLKALGTGLTVAPDELDVTGDHVKLPAREPAASLSRLGLWSLHDADVGPGYVATLAVEGDLSRPPTMRGAITQPHATGDADVSWNVRDGHLRQAASVATKSDLNISLISGS
jgi:4'-phosphopantetheinyl transferase